jgi:DNA-binding FadR family transcriptional regulator
MTSWNASSDFFDYLVSSANPGSDDDQLPTIKAISEELGIGVSQLREQIEVAKALGLIEVRPRTGMRRLDYQFSPAVWQSLAYAVEVNPGNFRAFSDLRRHIETAYWNEAVETLQAEDYALLEQLMDQAWQKLRGTPIRIPHKEHRQLHMTIYRRLNNPFVIGILEAFWKVYEAVGMNLYADYAYLQEVWNYHQDMVTAICSGNIESGFEALTEHTDLLYHRPEV